MKKITILLFAIAALGAGCKKFTDINTNPNQPLAVTPNVLLSAALTGSAGNVGTDFFNTSRWMGSFARSGNFITTPPVEDYQEDVSFADPEWQGLYAALNRWNNVEIAGKANPTALAFYIGAAKTMKALHFSVLVDGFGDVPYSQAFNLNKYPTPKYDDAKTIYADLVLQLDSAVTYFNNADAFYSTATASVIATDDQYDVMFGRGAGVKPATRMKNWIAFANTVKLRILLTEQDVIGGAAVTAELAKTTGGFLPAGTSASVNPGYSSSAAAKLSPFYSVFNNVQGQASNGASFFRANQYAVNAYSNTGDQGARANLTYAAAPGTNLSGNFDGDPAAASNAVTGSVGPGLVNIQSQDQWVLTDFESLFLQAEAVNEGYLTGDASALVKSGIEQSYVFLGDNVEDADDYVTAGAGNVLVDPATGLRAIMTQKWLALIGVDWEQSYTDFRRTGFPVQDGVNFGVTHAPQPTLHGGKPVIPFRYLYTQSEISTNGKNIPGAVTEYTPIFWDKREQ